MPEDARSQVRAMIAAQLSFTTGQVQELQGTQRGLLGMMSSMEARLAEVLANYRTELGLTNPLVRRWPDPPTSRHVYGHRQP